MKKTLIKTVSCCSLIVAALTLTSWAADNVMTKEDGMTVINTTTLGKSVEGYKEGSAGEVERQEGKGCQGT